MKPSVSDPALAENQTRIRLPLSGTSGLEAWYSAEANDAEWDRFLQRIPTGHFQQSSGWGRAKRGEGWETHRVVLSAAGQIAGGFQILARKSRLGRVGYIYKGPAVAPEHRQLWPTVLELLIATAKSRLQALVVQPPDDAPFDELLAARYNLLPNYLVKVTGATLVVDLAGGLEALESRMRKTTRQEVRQSQRRGVIVREGSRQDIGEFFRLMLATCARQKTNPVPASETALLAIWDEFQPAGKMRLLVSECEGQIVAGVLCFYFGSRTTLWKKGWAGAFADRHPNTLLHFESIRQAQLAGYRLFDFTTLNEPLAAALVSGQTLSEQQKSLRDMYHLGFGGAPVILPPSRVFITNPLIRSIYRIAASRPFFRRLIFRRLKKLAST